MTYEDARAAVEAILEAERTDKRVDPRCYSQLLDRGGRAERAIAFYHGFTNCPRQFIAIGQRFFDAGFNVFIPRLPGHGMADKMTTALKDVTRDDLTAAAAAAAQIAAGLGARVHVAGISLGGVLAAWVGEQTPIAGATAIAPFMGIKNVLGPLNSAVAIALDLLPDFFMWWDPRVGANNPATPPYAYARYTSRIIAAQLSIGSELLRCAKRQAPKARASALFANERDPAVNNSVAARLYQRWQERGANVLQEWFDGPSVHDIIDNFTGRLTVDTIYPAILDLVERADALGKADA